jgi:nitroimidazol reductase NimA-like FMN-containing flavoprotein (pyridoxamine 5'-phosphate oxidase superfamily)
VLSTEECVRLLSKAPVGRIVYTDRALPAVQPVTFVVDGWSIVIRTAPRSRLAVAVTRAVVAFEVDEFTDAPDRTGWSVVAVGRAEEVPPEDFPAVQRLGLRPWVAGARDHYLRVAIEIISGRRLVPQERSAYPCGTPGTTIQSDSRSG